MKRLLAFFLPFLLLFSLIGCVQSDTPDPTLSSPTASSPTEPTDADPAVDPAITERLCFFMDICNSLDFYQDQGYETFHFRGNHIPNTLIGNEALKYCYDLLRSMDDLKPYLNEESWSAVIEHYSLPEYTPEELLARFTIVEDVLLELKYVESPSTPNSITYDSRVIWRYNTKGELVHINQPARFGSGVWRLPEHRFYTNFNRLDLYFEYDVNSQLICPWLGDDKTGQYPIIPTYDDSGRLISEACGRDKLLYSYNPQGQLSRVEYIYHTGTNNGQDVFSKDYWEYSYQYDDNSRVTQCVENEFTSGNLHFTRTKDYAYDAAGRVCRVDQTVDWWEWYASEPYISQTQRGTIVYTYDDQGRILTESAVSGGEPDANGTPTKECILHTLIYVYGDQYIFDDYCVEYIDKTR